jgi:hypothetical protein
VRGVGVCVPLSTPVGVASRDASETGEEEERGRGRRGWLSAT